MIIEAYSSQYGSVCCHCSSMLALSKDAYNKNLFQTIKVKLSIPFILLYDLKYENICIELTYFNTSPFVYSCKPIFKGFLSFFVCILFKRHC